MLWTEHDAAAVQQLRRFDLLSASVSVNREQEYSFCGILKSGGFSKKHCQ